MEYLNGKDLEHAVAEAAMTLEDFYKVAEQTLDALSNAHRLNLMHRDIKPANIQVTWMANGSFICKFVDFGLARFFEKPSKQTVRPDGTVMGSVFYMAPEQLERRALDGRADLYSLGCVFYYLLSMHRPFEGGTVQEVINAHLTGNFRPLHSYRPQLPAAICQWVQWLMQRRIDQRPSDASEALTVLRNLRQGQPAAWPPGAPAAPPAPAPTAVRRPVKSKRRPRQSPLRWAVPALTAAAAVLTLSTLVWQRWKEANAAAPATRTAASVIAAAREAAAKANATTPQPASDTPAGQSLTPLADLR